MSEFFRLADRYGLGIVFTAFVLVALRWVCIRLFAEEKGIVTRVGESHVQLVDTLRENSNTQAAASVRIADATEGTAKNVSELKQWHGDTRSRFSVDYLHRAGLHACDVLAQVCNKCGVGEETEQSINAIRRELERK